jgi:hypothetical protein
MSIFVDENQTFPIVIYYTQVFNEENILLYTDVSDTPQDGWKILSTEFCQPSAGVFSDILEQATVVNSLSHKPVLRTRVLRDMILVRLMKKWSVLNNEGLEVPINEQTINNMEIKIANLLFISYIRNTKLDAVLNAIIREEKFEARGS